MAANVPVTRSHYKYTSDAGAVYRVRLANYIATQVDTAGNSIIGAVPSDGTEPPLPGGHQMRRAIVRDLVGLHDRVVAIPSPTAPILQVPQPAGAGTLTLNSPSGNQATYTYQGRYLTETRGRRV